ncbi:hypothetical protein LINPERPRIM_LOCUS23153 [Linum perenne]
MEFTVEKYQFGSLKFLVFGIGGIRKNYSIFNKNV